MKNNVLALLIAVVVLSPGTVPVVCAQAPATLSFQQGGQFSLNVSNTDPNMLFVPGDRITAISSQQGALTDKRDTSAGGVLFSTVATKAFTLFVETARGQAFSVVANPVAGRGQVYRLLSAQAPPRPEARRWETSLPYESLLIALGRSALTGSIPDGYGAVAPLPDGISVPYGMTAAQDFAWAGDQLRIDRYRLGNNRAYSIALREQDFWKPGVRAIMFDNGARTLLASGTLGVTVIRGTGEGRDGQHQ